MCGLSGIFGKGWTRSQLEAMVKAQHHRGPDANGIYLSPKSSAGLGHNRLSILDLSDAGRQPMQDSSGRYQITFNGEIYNYLELRQELSEYSFRTKTDTEVLLAAYQKWGEACLDRLIGMFAFMIWDEKEQKLFAARDRFGVKPLYYHQNSQEQLFLASEIKAIHAAGAKKNPDEIAWATYFVYGLYDHSPRTFWEGIASLPGGHYLTLEHGKIKITKWYDFVSKVGLEDDPRSEQAVTEDYLSILKQSVKLRFRADVPVGVNLSGGLDSSILLSLVHQVQGESSNVEVFTFICGDSNYDELPWVEKMLEKTCHPLNVCQLTPEQVPELAENVQKYEDEPYGGIPTLAYSKIFEQAKHKGVKVLLDGQGMDEQWAGYDYYAQALDNDFNFKKISTIQGTLNTESLADCLMPNFRKLAEAFESPQPFRGALRNLQYRDLFHTKIPRALRFNDRISMRSSVELREPFLDHRLVEIAFRQSADRKIRKGVQKWLLRKVASEFLPQGVIEVAKRPIQTPQREWLQTTLREWAEKSLSELKNAWFDQARFDQKIKTFSKRGLQNSFFVWQSLSASLRS